MVEAAATYYANVFSGAVPNLEMKAEVEPCDEIAGRCR
jgi:hypothetical protein